MSFQVTASARPFQALLLATLATLPLFSGCVATVTPEVIVSDDFPAERVSYPPPHEDTGDEYNPDHPESFWVQGPTRDWRANDAEYAWLQFNDSSFGGVRLMRWNEDDVRFVVTLKDVRCLARVTLGNVTTYERGTFEGVLDIEKSLVKVSSSAPCAKTFTMRRGA